MVVTKMHSVLETDKFNYTIQRLIFKGTIRRRQLQPSNESCNLSCTTLLKTLNDRSSKIKKNLNISSNRRVISSRRISLLLEKNDQHFRTLFKWIYHRLRLISAKNYNDKNCLEACLISFNKFKKQGIRWLHVYIFF